jgi:GNAT superfamily N-acetyltransferase
MDNYQFIRVNSSNMRFDLLHDFYYKICKNAFNEHELESYNDWEYVLENNYMTYFIIIVQNNTVIGGIVYEVYRQSSCTMLTYIAIDDKYRGTGLSKRLLNETINDIKLLQIKIILIEVAVPYNNPDAITRQHIWKKLNFTPTDIVYVHPGYLKWHPYQVAIYNPDCKEIIEINKKTMELFLTEYFGQILEDDEDKSDINTVQIVLNSTQDTVVIAKTSNWSK